MCRGVKGRGWGLAPEAGLGLAAAEGSELCCRFCLDAETQGRAPPADTQALRGPRSLSAPSPGPRSTFCCLFPASELGHEQAGESARRLLAAAPGEAARPHAHTEAAGPHAHTGGRGPRLPCGRVCPRLRAAPAGVSSAGPRPSPLATPSRPQSSVCAKIVQLLGQHEVDHRQKQVVILSQDSFYRVLTPEQKARALKGQFNFDHPGEWGAGMGGRPS